MIPKVKNPKEVKDFRPISLVSIVYKILSKILANRMKKVLPGIISPSQSAFIKNRQIMDGPLIVNEVIDWAKHNKKSIFIFKSDIAKAYDTVSWKYLDSMMQLKGFGQKWCQMVGECLRSGTSSVLINASPTYEFSLSRGLRQGDPLSPFLFTLVMEGLNNVISSAVTSNSYKGVEVGDNRVPLTHLFFADDSIFFGEWSVENILNIVRILFCFQKTAGLKLNLDKSFLFGIGQNLCEVENMALIIGCKAGQLPSIFLGMPIGVNMGAKKYWKTPIDKFKKKLANWKIKTLSIGGRHTLVCNVLGSLGNFLFSLFKVPKGVLKDMEKIRREFFWGGDANKSKIPWAKWEHVMTDKENGGLGVISLEDLNNALLAKWCWRFKKEEGALWKNIIVSIHKQEGTEMDSRSIRSGNTWKRIVKTWDDLKPINCDPRDFIKKRIGNGLNTNFWSERWFGETTMAQSFSRLFHLEVDQQATVANRIHNGAGQWNWRGNIREGRTREELENLENIITGVTFSDQVDRWECPGGPKNCFTVAWMRQKIADSKQYVIGPNRWCNWIPKKHLILAWRVLNDRIASNENLEKRGVLIGSHDCWGCSGTLESTTHVFITCPIAKEVWDICFGWWGLQRGNQGGVEDYLKVMTAQANSRKDYNIRFVVWAAIIAFLWKNRNEAIFNNKPKNAKEIFLLAQDEALNWINCRVSKIVTDRNLWRSSPTMACNSL